MKTYTEEEIKRIKTQEWDKGWRWGLLVATVIWVISFITVRLLFL